MSSANQIRATGKIVEVLQDGVYRIELANGHRAIACAEKNAPPLRLDDPVPLEFHPYDLSRGRIIS